MKSTIILLAACAVSLSALAKLPAPSDEAKAKAAEAAAKTAHAGKVDAFLLCKSQDRVAAHYQKTKGGAAKAAASACVDPGPYVPAAPAAAAAAAAPAPAAAPSAPAPAATDKKKS